MQKNHQPDHQFLQEMGALLAARAGQRRPATPAVTHLAEHVTSARRHQKLTRRALSQKMGVPEAVIYALEQGLLSYAELDLPFLGKLAAALGEDIETLLLLLGRPALVEALQRQKAPRTQEQWESFTNPSRIRGDTTTSKQRGNSFVRKGWVNALYKGCLNLIVSLRQGRLFSIRRVNDRLYPMAAMLLCLFLVGVSTYSIAGRFGAQSDIQASIPIPVRSDGRLPAQISGSMNHPTARSFQRLYPPVETMMTQPVTASIGGPTSVVALRAHHVDAETQQCVLLTIGRPAICRV